MWNFSILIILKTYIPTFVMSSFLDGPLVGGAFKKVWYISSSHNTKIGVNQSLDKDRQMD